MRKTVGYAKVYEDADHAAEVEHGHALERNKIGGEDADEESPEAEEA
jgi:small subunit ribosomal protein S24e